ncbi:MAG: phosphopantetheine-binding protein [Proteobacteria bacterium]|nr:phosphopantetheine-binding protein [Pseudomonadota bacterium]
MDGNSVNIENRIKKVIKKRLKLKVNTGEISKDTPLIGKGLGLDSIGVLELVVGLEEEFNIMFEDSELNIELFENIGSLTNYINKKLTEL